MTKDQLIEFIEKLDKKQGYVTHKINWQIYADGPKMLIKLKEIYHKIYESGRPFCAHCKGQLTPREASITIYGVDSNAKELDKLDFFIKSY